MPTHEVSKRRRILRVITGAVLVATCPLAQGEPDERASAGPASRTIDPSRLSTERQTQIYRETIALKSKKTDPSRFGFVEMVAIVGNIKTA